MNTMIGNETSSPSWLSDSTANTNNEKILLKSYKSQQNKFIQPVSFNINKYMLLFYHVSMSHKSYCNVTSLVNKKKLKHNA